MMTGIVSTHFAPLGPDIFPLPLLLIIVRCGMIMDTMFMGGIQYG